MASTTRVTQVAPIGDRLEDSTTQPCVYIPLEIRLKPMTIPMQFFGIYIPTNTTHNEPCKTGYGTAHSKVYTHAQLFKFYASVWFIISTFWILRYIPAFWVGFDFQPGSTTTRIVQFSWMLQSYMNTVVLLRASASSESLPAFYDHINKLITDRCSDNINMKPQCLRVQTRIYVGTVIAWLSWGVGVSGFLYLSLNGLNDSLKHPFSSDTSFYILLIISLWEIAAWLFPVIFRTLLLNILLLEFTTFKNALVNINKEDSSLLLKNIRSIRNKHLQLCKCVSILEQDLKYVIGGTYVTGLFLTCFLVYNMITDSTLIPIAYAIYGVYVVMAMCMLLSISIASSLVNEEVSVLYFRLHCGCVVTLISHYSNLYSGSVLSRCTRPLLVLCC